MSEPIMLIEISTSDSIVIGIARGRLPESVADTAVLVKVVAETGRLILWSRKPLE